MVAVFLFQHAVPFALRGVYQVRDLPHRRKDGPDSCKRDSVQRAFVHEGRAAGGSLLVPRNVVRGHDSLRVCGLFAQASTRAVPGICELCAGARAVFGFVLPDPARHSNS